MVMFYKASVTKPCSTVKVLVYDIELGVVSS